MATSREEREKRRAERLAAERAEQARQRRRMILGYVVAGALCLAVVVGLFLVITSDDSDPNEIDPKDLPEAAHINVNSGFTNGEKPDGREGTPPPPVEQGDLKLAAKEAGCELQTDLPDEGADHVEEDELPEWKTNPPTSGNHLAEQQADGAWLSVKLGATLHSLEHGRIDIQYSPDLSEEDQLALKGVFDESPDGVLFFPNPEMPYAVAATAWRQLLGCDSFEGRATLDAVRAFRDVHRGYGPEPFGITMGPS